MSRDEKTKTKILSGYQDANIAFGQCLINLGFVMRQKGSHHIFYREAIPEILNLQPKLKKAKAYQVKQVRDLILKYNL